MSAENLPAVRETEPKSIRAYLADQKFQMEAVKLLGDPALARRFARVCLTQVQSVPALLRCDVRTLASALLALAEVGLEPGRDAYLIPRGDTVTVTIRWEGYVRAARASKQIKRIWGDVIRERDAYSVTGGSDVPRVTHSYSLSEPRGEIIASYACAEWTDGVVETVVVDKDYLDRCRAASDSWRSQGERSVWGKWPDQMCKKVAIKRLCKGLPLGSTDRLEGAVSLDSDDDGDSPEIEAEPDAPAGGSRVTALKDKLAARLPEPEAPEEPEIEAEPEAVEPAKPAETRTRARRSSAKPAEAAPTAEGPTRGESIEAIMGTGVAMRQLLAAAGEIQGNAVLSVEDVGDATLATLRAMSDEEIRRRSGI